MNRPASILAFVLFLALVLAVGFGAGMVTASNVIGWYSTLAKPSFNPPNWVFAPVWTTLYVLIAIAVWRITGLRSRAMFYWFVQLALNFAWSFIFFGAHQTGVALMEVEVLWLTILMTMTAFFPIDRIAGLLFVPYLAWVSFAALLNYSVWQLNH